MDFETEVPIQEKNANVVTVIEKWESFPHLEAHFNAPHMEQMGWTPPGNILTVAQSGTYTVAALETQPGQAPASAGASAPRPSSRARRV